MRWACVLAVWCKVALHRCWQRQIGATLRLPFSLLWHTNPLSTCWRCLLNPPLQEGAPQPSIIHDSPMVRLWHRADPSFKVPKAALYIHLQLAGEPC